MAGRYSLDSCLQLIRQSLQHRIDILRGSFQTCKDKGGPSHDYQMNPKRLFKLVVYLSEITAQESPDQAPVSSATQKTALEKDSMIIANSRGAYPDPSRKGRIRGASRRQSDRSVVSPVQYPTRDRHTIAYAKRVYNCGNRRPPS